MAEPNEKVEARALAWCLFCVIVLTILALYSR